MTNFTLIHSWGSNGTGNTNLDNPRGVATDGVYLYIADYGNSRLIKWDMQGGKYVNKVSGITPHRILYNDGEVVIIDATSKKIIVYDAATLSEKRKSPAYTNPYGLAYGREKLWLCDYTDGWIKRLNYATFDVEKTHTTQLTSPAGIAYHPINGMIYVVDRDGQAIFQFDYKLAYQNKTYDLTGISALLYIQHISEHGGYLWLTETSGSYYLFDKSLQYLRTAAYADEDAWSSSYGITTFKKHYLLSCDYTASKIQLIYAYDRAAGAASADAIEFDDWAWDFGDDVTIGGSEANITARTWLRDKSRKKSRYEWLRA